MKRHEEIVFEILGEGGRISILRQSNEYGEKFIYHHSEFDPTNEGLGVNKKGEFNNFEQPFQLINNKYSWYTLHVETVHEDYREFVLNQLIEKLNKDEISPDQSRNFQNRLEEAFHIKLEFGQLPSRSGLQEITIKFFIGTTKDYDYNLYGGNYLGDSVRNDDLKVTTATERIDWKEYKCNGKIEYSGSTIIIKDEYNQPKYVFSSEKAFITTIPILGSSKGWYYKSV